MNDVLIKVEEAIRNYHNKYERQPNAILINEHDLDLLKHLSAPFRMNNEELKKIEALKQILTYECYGLKVIPIKYGEPKAVEVLE